jgi:NitT/TauT family transport system permease protein
MWGFIVFAVAFVAVLTAVVRLAQLRVRGEVRATRAMALTLLFGVVLLGVWWFLTSGKPDERIVQSLILPSPLEVLQAFGPLHFEQGLVRSAVSSWIRVTAGFTLAAIVAVPLGIYMATFPGIAAFFRPLALAGAYVPIVVFIPLSLTWFGTGETQKVGFLFIGCFVALLPLVIKSIADVPAAFLDVAVTKGASQWQLVRHVLFPVAKQTSGTIYAGFTAWAGAGSLWLKFLSGLNTDLVR